MPPRAPGQDWSPAISRAFFLFGAMLAVPAFGLGIDWLGVRQRLAGLAAVIAGMGLVAALLIAHAGVVLARNGRPRLSQEAGLRDGRQATFWKLFTVFLLAASA